MSLTIGKIEQLSKYKDDYIPPSQRDVTPRDVNRVSDISKVTDVHKDMMTTPVYYGSYPKIPKLQFRRDEVSNRTIIFLRDKDDDMLVLGEFYPARGPRDQYEGTVLQMHFYVTRTMDEIPGSVYKEIQRLFEETLSRIDAIRLAEVTT